MRRVNPQVNQQLGLPWPDLPADLGLIWECSGTCNYMGRVHAQGVDKSSNHKADLIAGVRATWQVSRRYG